MGFVHFYMEKMASSNIIVPIASYIIPYDIIPYIERVTLAALYLAKRLSVDIGRTSIWRSECLAS